MGRCDGREVREDGSAQQDKTKLPCSNYQYAWPNVILPPPHTNELTVQMGEVPQLSLTECGSPSRRISA